MRKTTPKEGDKECATCKRTFHYLRKSTNPAPATCSKECAYKLRGLVQQKRVQRKCATCGKLFDMPPAWLRKIGSRGFYCSRACRWSKPIEYEEAQKKAARIYAYKAITEGRLKKDHCYFCESLDVETHHYKGYDEENFLEVIWLCKTHHNRFHEILRKMGLNQYL